MDKRKVLSAYRQGTITLQECAQIIGVELIQLGRLVDDPVMQTGALQLRRLDKATS